MFRLILINLSLLFLISCSNTANINYSYKDKYDARTDAKYRYITIVSPCDGNVEDVEFINVGRRGSSIDSRQDLTMKIRCTKEEIYKYLKLRVLYVSKGTTLKKGMPLAETVGKIRVEFTPGLK
jgi:hypothetical protein